MLRDLGKTRQNDIEPTDSIFLVLFAEEVPGPSGNTVTSWQPGSAWLSLGEAQGAGNRYSAEGHKAHHGWTYCRVFEMQTGQLAPKVEAHGEPIYPVSRNADAPLTEADEEAALELRLAQLKAKRGVSQSVG